MPALVVVVLVPDAVHVLGIGGVHRGVHAVGGVDAAHGKGQVDDLVEREVGRDVIHHGIDDVDHLHRGGAHELLEAGVDEKALVGGTVAVAVAKIVVGVARAGKELGLCAVKHLQTRIEVASVDVAHVLGVVDLVGNVDFHTTEGVSHSDECVDVDLGIVRHGNLGEVGDLLDDSRGTAAGIVGVDLAVDLGAVGVAVDGHERHNLLARVDAGQDDGVGTVVGRVGSVLILIIQTLFHGVDTQKQHVEGRGVGPVAHEFLGCDLLVLKHGLRRVVDALVETASD